MAKKIYAVKVGRTNGIFETWDECKASVNGYPGALYKSFTNMADAYAYLNLESKQMSLFDMPSDDSVDDSDFPVIKESVEDDDKPFSNSVKAVAYVDGSYNIATKHFSYGCVSIDNTLYPVSSIAFFTASSSILSSEIISVIPLP